MSASQNPTNTAIMSVTGADHTGIVAAVATRLAQKKVNILNISQTLMGPYFTMILQVDLGELTVADLQEAMSGVSEEQAMEIRVQSEAIFAAINRI